MITAAKFERVLAWLLGAIGHEVGVSTFGATRPKALADLYAWAATAQPGDERGFPGMAPLVEFRGRLDRVDHGFRLAIELDDGNRGELRLDPDMVEDADWYLVNQDGDRDINAPNPSGHTDWSGLTLLWLRLDGMEPGAGDLRQVHGPPRW